MQLIAYLYKSIRYYYQPLNKTTDTMNSFYLSEKNTYFLVKNHQPVSKAQNMEFTLEALQNLHNIQYGLTINALKMTTLHINVQKNNAYGLLFKLNNIKTILERYYIN